MFLDKTKKYPENLLDTIFEYEKIEYTKEIKENLGQIIEGLSEKDKELLLLRFRDQLLIKEISEIVNNTEGNISNRIQFSIRKLKNPIIKQQILGNFSENIKYALENYPISLRSYNALKRNGIHRLDQIKNRRQLSECRNIGNAAIWEIVQIAEKNGIIIPEK